MIVSQEVSQLGTLIFQSVQTVCVVGGAIAVVATIRASLKTLNEKVKELATTVKELAVTVIDLTTKLAVLEARVESEEPQCPILRKQKI
jgi:outer membrane murein-binding lipoprotein Lpp